MERRSGRKSTNYHCFGADHVGFTIDVGGSVGIGVTLLCLHGISLTRGWDLPKLTGVNHWDVLKSGYGVGVLVSAFQNELSQSCLQIFQKRARRFFRALLPESGKFQSTHSWYF